MQKRCKMTYNAPGRASSCARHVSGLAQSNRRKPSVGCQAPSLAQCLPRLPSFVWVAFLPLWETAGDPCRKPWASVWFSGFAGAHGPSAVHISTESFSVQTKSTRMKGFNIVPGKEPKHIAYTKYVLFSVALLLGSTRVDSPVPCLLTSTAWKIVWR